MLLHDLVQKWEAAKSNLDFAKRDELRLRKEVCKILFGEKEGEFLIKKEIDENKIIKANSKVTRTIDWDILEIDKEDTEARLLEKMLKIIDAEIYLDFTQTEVSLFKVKLDWNETAYKNADPDEVQNFTSAMTIKPATTTLEIKYNDE